MSDPQPSASTPTNIVALVALGLGVLAIFVNPYLIVSVAAVVVGLVGLAKANATVRAGGSGTARIFAIVGIALGVAAAVFAILTNTVTALIR